MNRFFETNYMYTKVCRFFLIHVEREREREITLLKKRNRRSEIQYYKHLLFRVDKK